MTHLTFFEQRDLFVCLDGGRERRSTDPMNQQSEIKRMMMCHYITRVNKKHIYSMFLSNEFILILHSIRRLHLLCNRNTVLIFISRQTIDRFSFDKNDRKQLSIRTICYSSVYVYWLHNQAKGNSMDLPRFFQHNNSGLFHEDWSIIFENLTEILFITVTFSEISEVFCFKCSTI